MMRTLRHDNIVVILLIVLGKYMCVVSHTNSRQQSRDELAMMAVVRESGESIPKKLRHRRTSQQPSVPTNHTSSKTSETIHFAEVEDRELDTELFVIGGENVANLSRYPYMVFLRSYKVAQNGRRLPKATCGAVLIDSYAVLTAAHCVAQDVQELGEDLQIELFLGYSNRGGAVRYDEKFTVPGKFGRTVFLHPDGNLLNRGTGELPKNDLAVIILNGCSTKSYIGLNRNSRLDSLDGAPVCIIGYGTTASTSNNLSGILQKAQLKIDTQCYPWGPHLPMNKMMCTDTRDGKGSCKGDSGGPIVSCGSSPQNDQLLAIVSFGHQCADTSNIPSVNTLVRTSRDWINSVLQENQPSC